jgi:hypothetical protein
MIRVIEAENRREVEDRTRNTRTHTIIATSQRSVSSAGVTSTQKKASVRLQMRNAESVGERDILRACAEACASSDLNVPQIAVRVKRGKKEKMRL